MILRELWTFFVITLVVFGASATGDFVIRSEPPVSSQADCQRKQGYVSIPHGQELLVLTDCVKIPERRKL